MTAREDLAAAYLRLHPESAARLIESMPVEQANAVLKAVDVATVAPVVEHMLPTCAAQCLERQAPADAAAVLERLIRDAADRGVPVLLVTHDRAQAGRLADAVLELDAGRVV